MKKLEKKILILGGSGYIGRAINNFFPKKNILSTYKNHKIKNSIYFDFEKTDINKILLQYPNIDKILILGGIVKFSEILKDKNKAYKINVKYLKKILSVIKKKNIVPIFFSSESVFNGKKGEYKEYDKPNPIFDYAKHKYEIEKYIIKNFRKYKILRISKVYDNNIKGGTLLVKWILQLKNKENIFCAEDNYFTPIHIDDVCKMTKKIISIKNSGIFHLASNKSLNRKEMLQKIIKKVKPKILKQLNIKYQSLHSFKGAESQPLNTSLNCTKTNRIIGLKAKGLNYNINKILKSKMFIPLQK